MPVLFSGVTPAMARTDYAKVKHKYLLGRIAALKAKSSAVADRAANHITQVRTCALARA